MIEKTYFYGAGQAGVETITDLDDFILYHIQDEEVGLRIANDLANGETETNFAADEEVMEVYEATDTDLLREAIDNYEEA